jgi:flavodoxin
MHAVVVYGAPYENTRLVAAHVADGLRATHQVTVAPVAGATADFLAGTDLLVVGGPTHVRGLSSGIHEVFKGLDGWPELPPPSTPGSAAARPSPAGPAGASPGS